MASNGLEICIDTFFRVALKLLLTKKCLKLTWVWVRKILSCYVSVIKTVAKYKRTKTSILQRVNLYSQFVQQVILLLTYSCFYSHICIIPKVNVSKKICSLKMTFRTFERFSNNQWKLISLCDTSTVISFISLTMA